MEFQHELVLPNEDIPFKMFVFEGRNGSYIREKHWHRSIEIFALFDGDLRFYVNDAEYRLKAGEFMLMNSNEIHSIAALKPNYTIVLQIPLRVFEKYYTGENFIRFSHSARIQDEKFMQLIRDMYRTYSEKKSGYELKVQSWFYMLIYLLVTKYRKTDVSVEEVKHNRKLNRLTSITDYLRDNYTKELSLESLAKIFGYSPTYLSHMFQTYAQTNYKSYLQNIRVERAYYDLAGSDETIGEIAERHGFANSKAFSREFKKKYGQLPSEYRRQTVEKNKEEMIGEEK